MHAVIIQYLVFLFTHIPNLLQTSGKVYIMKNKNTIKEKYSASKL